LYEERKELTATKQTVFIFAEILLTAEELRKYDGSEGSPGTYLGLLGQVFDVSSGLSIFI
jgi:hypothetical protein